MSNNSSFARNCAKLSDWLADISTYIAGALFLVNVADILMGVFARYFFQSSPVWTEELARYTIIWMVMIAANPALKKGEHMKIDILIKYFPSWLKISSRMITHVIFIFMTGFMTYFGYFYALKIMRFTTMGLGISKMIPMLAIPIGMALLLVQYLLMQFSHKSEEVRP